MVELSAAQTLGTNNHSEKTRQQCVIKFVIFFRGACKLYACRKLLNKPIDPYNSKGKEFGNGRIAARSGTVIII